MLTLRLVKLSLFLERFPLSSKILLSWFRGFIDLSIGIFLGPNLNGLFGRQSGTTPGYSYSAANKGMAVIWEEKTLYDYLLNPKKVRTGSNSYSLMCLQILIDLCTQML